MNCTKNNEISDVNIRLSNISDLNFENIIVNPGSSERVNYGNIDSGMFSDYKNFEKAYGYGFVELTANGEKYSIVPIDYVGESPLRDGDYTYQLDLVKRDGGYSELTINLIQE
ncbi:hypothetical protein [Flaviramulus basaltis]|uniref:hypothetical protein n=1 Tax=Flaviramulus basaltis TaxID=369401 RepID=UPI001160822B|nr:hypothetical protein [Flaviramulus basaltis]